MKELTYDIFAQVEEFFIVPHFLIRTLAYLKVGEVNFPYKEKT